MTGSTPLPADERHELLIAWNRTEAPISDLRLHQLVERQFDLAPERIAIEFGDATLSFGALEERANRLANHLRRLGAGPGARVGVSLPRSFDLTIALLGVLKSGAAFVPLDTAEPPERLLDKIADAKPAAVITTERLAEALAGKASRIIVPTREAAAIAESPASRPAIAVRADDPAYLTYTSGSTGRPKGVLVSHRGVVNRIEWFLREFPFAAGERGCAKTALGFVDAICEIFAPLACGARTFIVSEEVATDPLLLAAELERGGIRKIFLVPTTLRALLHAERARPGRFRALELWLVGGERLADELALQFLQQLPDAKLFNLYGATEVSAEASLHAVTSVTPGDAVPIGRPIQNAQLFVVDAEGEPVRLGDEGEIWIGGAGVSLGYHDRPELDEAKFVKSKWPEWPSARFYRTGDRGRFRADGALECLGRIDDEFKVNGVRIDPSEIEHALRAHPAVREIVVSARGSDTSRRLVAYVVWKGAPEAAELRRFAAKKLPPWLVPTVVVDLDALPLFPSGKVDRRRLPEPPSAPTRRPSSPPKTETERKVAAAWEETLGVESVGGDEDFFTLGGDSLRAHQLLARIRESIAPLTLPDLFAAPTVAEQAALIDGGKASSGPELVRVPRGAPMALSPAQETMWLFEEIVPGTTLYIITRGVELRGVLDRARLERSVHAVCARQEALRTKLVLDDGRPYQVIVEKVSWEHRVVDHSDLDEEARQEAFSKLEIAWIQRPFDFTRAPPWRTTLVREAEDVYVLLLSGHHVLFDARSMRRWFVEVLEHYIAFEEARSPTVPELPFHAVDVAAWHLRRFHEGALEKERAYWQKQLLGAPTGLRLGAFGAERAKGGAGHDGARRVLRLPDEQVQSLRRIGQAHGATSLATYVALFAVVLGRVTGEDEFIIGTPVDLRDRPELVPLIGMLVHALALRFDLAGEPTFSELLVRVRDVARAALTNSAVSMGDIVEDLSLGRSVYRQPLFEVMFDLTRQEPVPSSPTLAATPITEGTEPVPRDLVLRVRESAGDEVEIVMEWRVRMIPKELAAVLWKGFLNLTRQVAEDPNRAISEYVLG